MKTCTKCSLEKPLELFGFKGRKNKAGEDERKSCCKACEAVAKKQKRNETPGALEALAEYGRKYRVKRRDPNTKTYYIAKDGTKQCPLCLETKPLSEYSTRGKRNGHSCYCRKCCNLRLKDPEIRQQAAARKKHKYNTDDDFRFACIMRENLRASLLFGKNLRSEEYFGCPPEELRQRIAAQFEPGMSWENYGYLKGGGDECWEVGHRRPIALFDPADNEAMKECWHCTNLVPQWRKQNRAQGAKYEGIDFAGLRHENYGIKVIPIADARVFVETYHYSGSMAAAATICFGFFEKTTDKLVGTAIYRPAPYYPAKELSPADPKKILGLSRFVLASGLPHNAASHFLSATIKHLKRFKRWDMLLTFADTWQGHTGTIYKASNWKYLGLTKPQPVYTLDGKLISNRWLWTNPDKRAQAIFQGMYPKHKFVYPLR